MLTKDWYHNPDEVLTRIERLLQGIVEKSDKEPFVPEEEGDHATEAELSEPAEVRPTAPVSAPEFEARQPNEPLTPPAPRQPQCVISNWLLAHHESSGRYRLMGIHSLCALEESGPPVNRNPKLLPTT